jgi:hypothetical protein
MLKQMHLNEDVLYLRYLSGDHIGSLNGGKYKWYLPVDAWEISVVKWMKSCQWFKFSVILQLDIK